jgi:hypothetical protein
MYAKVGLIEETKGGGNKTQGNTVKTVKQHRIWEKGKEGQWVTLTLAQCMYRYNTKAKSH